jgi:hypothetical protein
MDSLLRSLGNHPIPRDQLELSLVERSFLSILNSRYWKHVEFYAFSNTKSKHYFHIYYHTLLLESKMAKRVGIGATCSVGVRYLHPSKRLRNERFSSTTPKQRLSGLSSLWKESKKLNRENQCCVVFWHDDYPNIELFCQERWCEVEQDESPENSLFDSYSTLASVYFKVLFN